MDLLQGLRLNDPLFLSITINYDKLGDLHSSESGTGAPQIHDCFDSFGCST